VCENTFWECSKKLEFGRYLLLGKGEQNSGGRDRVSILADLFETVTGAIYLDGGLENAKKFAISNLHHVITDAVNGIVFMDYKTQLQEILQKDSNCKISYATIDERGPEHNKEFVVQVKNKEILLGQGTGKTKKEAEQLFYPGMFLHYHPLKQSARPYLRD
jgi:ribonuclease-3